MPSSIPEKGSVSEAKVVLDSRQMVLGNGIELWLVFSFCLCSSGWIVSVGGWYIGILVIRFGLPASVVCRLFNMLGVIQGDLKMGGVGFRDSGLVLLYIDHTMWNRYWSLLERLSSGW